MRIPACVSLGPLPLGTALGTFARPEPDFSGLFWTFLDIFTSVSWRARQESNLRPLAPEAHATPTSPAAPLAGSGFLLNVLLRRVPDPRHGWELPLGTSHRLSPISRVGVMATFSAVR